MTDASCRFGPVLQLSRAALLMLTALLLGACAPVCDVVDSWSPCYAEIHGDDPLALHSEIDEPPAAEQADTVAQARPVVRALVVEENLPGLSVAVGIGGDIAWAEGFGWADLDERRPVMPKTLFRIRSVASSISTPQ